MPRHDARRTEYPGVPLRDWGGRLSAIRNGRGFNQRELAVAAGVSQQTVSKIERGTLCPHDLLKVRLAVALQVPVGAIFSWPEQPPQLSE